ncbi:hypothetical protein HPB50_023000 [Hyalomma asiaticum]|uniref:Uncharacterized protein n=1 Tax=Hyalomma asiaticum TaxID=266040 RepID=A0ACB7SZ69_HYAAI|nr:hypothetical protein HPB50_023000 [Hyalomma asiaticum]
MSLDRPVGAAAAQETQAAKMRRAILFLFCVATAYGQQKGGVSIGGSSGPGGALSGLSQGGPSGGGGGGIGIQGGPGGPGGGGAIGLGGPGGPGGPSGGGESNIMFGGSSEEGGRPEGGAGIAGFGSQQGQLDLFTLLMRQIFLAYGADPLRLPETTLPFSSILRMSGTVHTYNSFVYGLSHVMRTGPCFVTADQSGMRLGLDLGIKDVFGNSSATVMMANKNLRKQKVHFTVIVRKARAILEIAQTGPHEIHVTNFKILFLQGFKLFLRPQQQSRRPLFRAFLRAAQTFLEMSVKKRLEPLVRKAIDTQIKQVLAYLNREAQLRPKPRLPPEIFTGGAEGIIMGGGQAGGFPSGPGGGQGRFLENSVTWLASSSTVSVKFLEAPPLETVTTLGACPVHQDEYHCSREKKIISHCLGCIPSSVLPQPQTCTKKTAKMRREQSTRPEGSSSISEGGRPLKMSKRRSDTTQAAAKPATPAAPLDSEPAKMAGKDSDVSRPRSSIHRPSSTASFWSVQSAAGPAATAARDPEHSTLVAAAAADLEVDVRRSRKRRRIHEVPASPAEEPPEVSTANSRVSTSQSESFSFAGAHT